MVLATVPKRSQRSMLNNVHPKGPELKSMDAGPSNYSVPLTASFGSVLNISGCPQGVGNNERIGRQTILKSVLVNAKMVGATSATQYRALCVYDKQPNGALPASSDILNVNNFNSPLNLNNSDRFVVLFDQISDNINYFNGSCSTKAYKKFNLEQSFIGTGSTISSIGTGSVLLLFANNADDTVGVATTLNYMTRVRYTDA